MHLKSYCHVLDKMLCSETTVLQVKILDLILVLSGSTHGYVLSFRNVDEENIQRDLSSVVLTDSCCFHVPQK
jgi:hypothetical protein